MMIMFAFIGGFISWKVISDKEKQRAKECMSREEVLYFSNLESTLGKMLIGFFDGMFLYPILSIREVSDIIIFFILMLWIAWYFSHNYPLFAITNDSFILWKYYGFANPKKYNLSELTRKEFDTFYNSTSIHFVVLYQGKRRINKFDSTAHKDEDKLLELLRQIPEKQE